MKRNRIFFFLLNTLVLNNCLQKNSEGNKDGYIPVVKYSVEQEKLNPEKWSCYNLKNETVCIPKEWPRIEINKALFYAGLGNNNENTYFGITAYLADVEPHAYLKGMYNAFLNDTVEKAISYKLTELVFSDKTAYYAELYTKKDTINYCFFLMFWKAGGITYDFGLKTRVVEKDKYYKLFQAVLYNFQSKGKYVFSNKDEMEKIKHLKFEDL
jgi:hypothetical protein